MNSTKMGIFDDFVTRSFKRGNLKKIGQYLLLEVIISQLFSSQC